MADTNQGEATMRKVWTIAAYDVYHMYDSYYFAGFDDEKEFYPDFTLLDMRAIEYTDEDAARSDCDKLIELGYRADLFSAHRFITSPR
jgi:L-ascorbate metabolism protein UlaG (beta-lactamase superfamily)